jgi:hypothetical protein
MIWRLHIIWQRYTNDLYFVRNSLLLQAHCAIGAVLTKESSWNTHRKEIQHKRSQKLV